MNGDTTHELGDISPPREVDHELPLNDDSRTVVVNSLLCFISNFGDRISDHKLAQVIDENFPATMVKQARSILLILLEEDKACSNNGTEFNREGARDLSLLPLFNLVRGTANRVVFAASDLHTLPLIPAFNDEEEEEANSSDGTTSMKNLLGEVRQMKLLLLNGFTTSDGAKTAKIRLKHLGIGNGTVRLRDGHSRSGPQRCREDMSMGQHSTSSASGKKFGGDTEEASQADSADASQMHLMEPVHEPGRRFEEVRDKSPNSASNLSTTPSPSPSTPFNTPKAVLVKSQPALCETPPNRAASGGNRLDKALRKLTDRLTRDDVAEKPNATDSNSSAKKSDHSSNKISIHTDASNVPESKSPTSRPPSFLLNKPLMEMWMAQSTGGSLKLSPSTNRTTSARSASLLEGSFDYPTYFDMLRELAKNNPHKESSNPMEAFEREADESDEQAVKIIECHGEVGEYDDNEGMRSAEDTESRREERSNLDDIERNSPSEAFNDDDLDDEEPSLTEENGGVGEDEDGDDDDNDGVEKPYRCSQANCRKRFTNKFLLKKHQFIHTGLRPHLCPFCLKRFNRKDNLLRHKKTHLANAQLQQDGTKRRHNMLTGISEEAANVFNSLLTINGIDVPDALLPTANAGSGSRKRKRKEQKVDDESRAMGAIHVAVPAAEDESEVSRKRKHSPGD